MSTVIVGTKIYETLDDVSEKDRTNFKMKSIDNKYSLVAKYGPLEVTHSELNREYDVVARPLRLPILVTGNAKLRQMSFELYLAHQDPYISVEDDIVELRNLATHQSRVQVSYGGQEGGLFHILSMTWTSKMRHPRTQSVTRATVQIVLVASNFTNVASGPLTGGAVSGAGTTVSNGKPVRYHRVRKGESLQEISTEYYGQTKFYTLIMDANKIKKPKDIEVGQRLTIPFRTS